MISLRKVIILNDDINSARAFLSNVSSSEFHKVDAFKNLRKNNKWTLEDVKEEILYFFTGKDTNDILILDIELETTPQDGISFFNWFRKEGYTQPVLIYSGHISRLESIEKAKAEMVSIGLSEDLIWFPVIDSQLKEVNSLLRNSKNITPYDLEELRDSKTIPWRFEYFQEISFRLLILDDNNISEIKQIIGLDENSVGVKGKYERFSRLNQTEKEIFQNIQIDVARIFAMPSGTNFFNNELFSKLYNNIYNSLAYLCREQMTLVLTDE